MALQGVCLKLEVIRKGQRNEIYNLPPHEWQHQIMKMLFFHHEQEAWAHRKKQSMRICQCRLQHTSIMSHDLNHVLLLVWIPAELREIGINRKRLLYLIHSPGVDNILLFLRSAAVHDENTSRASSSSNSYSSSPSSERRATDYENVELPYRSPSRSSPSSTRTNRNAYEILPPHVLHAPIEPGSPKPDAQGRIRPPIPKPYREKPKASTDTQNDSVQSNSRGELQMKTFC